MSDMRELMETMENLSEGRRTGVDYVGPATVTHYDNNEVVIEINGDTLEMSIGDWENFVDGIKEL